MVKVKKERNFRPAKENFILSKHMMLLGLIIVK